MNKRALVIDVETTTINKGHPFSYDNKLVLVGCYDGNKYYSFLLHEQNALRSVLDSLNDLINQFDLLVGFNIKFDLHWLKRYGISFSSHSIYDCQLAEFLAGGCSEPFPSLDGTCSRRGLGSKLPAPDFNSANPDEIVPYNEQDCILTWKCYEHQKETIPKNLLRNIWVSCQDLLVTQEMEFNGLKYDLALSEQIGNKLNERIAEIDVQLGSIVDNDRLNFGSNHHVSAILFGGSIIIPERETYTHTYKDGTQKEKQRWVDRTYEFRKLVEPLKGSETKHEGIFSVDDSTLRKIKSSGTSKKIIGLILERRKLKKQVSTYFHGFLELYKDMQWEEGFLHGQLNHCRAGTGRLASSNPNQQNLEETVRQCLVSRFPLKKEN